MPDPSPNQNTPDLAAIIALAVPGADPAKVEPLRGRVLSIPDEPDVWELRSRLNMSQREFAAAFGLSPSTVENWEQGRTKPEGAAKVLLAVIERMPVQVLQALYR